VADGRALAHRANRQLPDAGIVALSANFTLYGDMSNRLMSIAAGNGAAAGDLFD
jgi:hypothetical protein